MSTSTNEKLTYLNCEADWRPWYNMIQGRASFLEIWDEVINPDDPTTFIAKQPEPQRPKIVDYEAKPDVEVPTRRSDLTRDGLRAFKEDEEEHRNNIHDWKIQHGLYREQGQKIYQLSTLIQSTAASHLQESSCLAVQ
ncbi:hypothetical protein E4U17_000879, partial [Claviceps sp. LM77 group G4]